MSETCIPTGEKTSGSAFPSGALPACRILVVEDESSIRHFSATALLRSGYRVDTAEDGEVAWSLLQRSPYDLMLTDNSMPKISGLELIKMVFLARMNLPAIMISGAFPNEEFARSPWLRPAATLLKPFSVADLLETVAKLLRGIHCSRGPDDRSRWQPQPDANCLQLC